MGNNKKENIYKTLSSYKKQLEEKGYNVIYISLYGSQNYNLDDEYSDIDARAVVLLSLKDLIKRKSISTTIDLDKGQVDIKDVASYVEQLRKGNPAYTETAQTEYYIGDKEFRKLIEPYEYNPMAAIGMMHEKRKAIEKYLPSSLDLKENEYDPKQYHHIVRLYNLLYDGVVEYNGVERDDMMILKREQYLSRDEVLSKASYLIEDVKNIYFDYQQPKENDKINEWLEKQYINTRDGLLSNPIIALEQHRTFGGDLPRNVRRALTDEQLELVEGKDVQIVTTYEIEVY